MKVLEKDVHAMYQYYYHDTDNNDLHTLLVLFVVNFFSQQDYEKNVEKKGRVGRRRVCSYEGSDCVTYRDDGIRRQIVGTLSKQWQRSYLGKVRTFELEAAIGGIVNRNCTESESPTKAKVS